MHSIRNLVTSSTKNSLSRTMSSLAPGHVLGGARWNYRILNPLEGDGTHTSAVFKAKVVPHENASNAPQWALIKTASPDDAVAIENLGRERDSYRLAGVASASCFRQMYEVIDDSTIALEWLDTTLAEIPYSPGMRTYALIAKFLGPTLSSCVVLGAQEHVNTVFPTGDRLNAQPSAMRAPEVFLGQACTEKSQVWAVAATVLCWIKPGVLGNCPYPFIGEAWCMAKIMRLFPDWELPASDTIKRETLQVALDSARQLKEEVEELNGISPLEEELNQVEMPQELRDLLRLMFITNPDKRPSASFVLASEEMRAFKRVVGE
ncbi:MAG: hypothetical protein Q9184_004638 [Pyrenodesmia sp. 2 TL-2023]